MNQKLEKNQQLKKQQSQNNLIWLGTIVNTQGLKGEVRVITNSSYIEQRFKKNNILYIEKNNQMIEVKIERSRLISNELVVVKFCDLNKIEDVVDFKNHKVYVEKGNIKRTKDDFFLSEVIDFKVIGDDGQVIGQIKDYWNQGPYYSFDIKLIDRKDIVNLPVIKTFVEEVNMEDKTIKLTINKDFFN